VVGFIDRVQEDATNAVGTSRATLGECDEAINIDISRHNGGEQPKSGKVARHAARQGALLLGRGQTWQDTSLAGQGAPLRKGANVARHAAVQGAPLGKRTDVARYAAGQGSLLVKGTGSGADALCRPAGGHDATTDRGPKNEVASKLAQLAFLGWTLCGGRLWGNDDASN
jgi:hypothetical protein